MTLRARVMLAAALLAATGTGCDDPVENSGDIIVENASAVSISQVYIRDCPIKFWGDNRLEDTEVIPPGGQHRFGVEAGCFDLLVYFQTERTVDRHNIEVASGAAVVWAVHHPDLSDSSPESPAEGLATRLTMAPPPR